MQYLFIFLALIIFSGKTHAQWQQQHPSGFNNSLYKIVRPTGSDKPYAIGSGLLSVSDDGGKSWQTQDLGLPIELRNNASTIHTTVPFKDVFFTSENTGYLLSKNIIYKTTDRGDNWQEVLNIKPNRDKFSTSAYFESLFFADENVGYAVGWFDKIFKTTDAGASWDTLRWSKSSTPFRRLTAVHFLDAETGFVAGYEIDDYFLNIGVYQHFLMGTTDGGKSWNEILLGCESDHQLADIQFIDDNIGYLLLSNQNRFFPLDEILKTTDGGATWDQLSLPNMIIRDMAWADENTGFAVGGPGLVLTENLVAKTVDGGVTWSQDTLPTWEGFNMNHCFDIDMLDGQRGIIVGAGGSVYYTTNQGDDWETGSFTYPDLQSINMLSDELGYAAGANGLLMKTTDGTQWDTLPNTGYFDAVALDFENELQGRLLTATGLHATQDGGLQWQDAFANSDTVMLRFERHGADWWAISRINSQKKLVLMKSKDRGKSWDTKPAYDMGNTISQVFDLAVLQEDTLLLSTPKQILKTENGGLSWKPVLSLEDGSNDFLMDVYAVDKQSAFLYTRLGKVWKTGDGGQQWEEVYAVPYIDNQFKIFFLNDREGFLVGNAQRQLEYPKEGILLYTEDGGQHWAEQDIPKNEGLTSMAWAPSLKSVYVTGKFGTILKSSQNLVTGIEGMEKTPLSVYPNPAAGAVHFSLPFPAGTQIEVRLLDISGHEVLKQKLTTGQKQVATLDLQALRQGLYILSIMTGDEKLVGRVILSGD